MVMETIPIKVDWETAQAFYQVTEEERRKLEILLGLRLRDLLFNPPRTLKEIMDDLGAEAEARGLTPEVLEELLHVK